MKPRVISRRRSIGKRRASIRRKNSDNVDDLPSCKSVPRESSLGVRVISSERPLFKGDPEIWTDAHLDLLVDRLISNLDIRDRKWHMRKYSECFVAQDAITLMLNLFSVPSRVLGERIGEILRGKGHLRHVVDSEKRFKDKYLFFRITRTPNVFNPSREESDPSSTCDAQASSPSSSDQGSFQPRRATLSPSFYGHVNDVLSLGKRSSSRSSHASSYETSDSSSFDPSVLNDRSRSLRIPRSASLSAPSPQRLRKRSVRSKSTNSSRESALVPKADVLSYPRGGDAKEWLDDDETLVSVLNYLKEYLDIRDRRWRLRKYKRCFVAMEAVAVICTGFGIFARSTAVALGEELRRRGLIWHVVDEHKVFCDEYLFFRIQHGIQFSHQDGAETSEFQENTTHTSTSEVSPYPVSDGSTLAGSTLLERDRSYSLTASISSKASSGIIHNGGIKFKTSLNVNNSKMIVLFTPSSEMGSDDSTTLSGGSDDWVDPDWVQDRTISFSSLAHSSSSDLLNHGE